MGGEGALGWAYLLAGAAALAGAVRASRRSLSGFGRSPLAVALAYFGFAFLIVPGLNLLFGISFWQSSYRGETLERGLWLSLAFVVLLAAGYRCSAPTGGHGHVEVRPIAQPAWSMTVAALAMMGALGLALLARSVLEAGGLANYFILRNTLAAGEGPSLILTALWQAIPALIVVQVVAWSRGNVPVGRWRVVLAATLLVAVAIGLFQGSRTKALFPLLAAGMTWVALQPGDLPRRLKAALLSSVAGLALIGGVLGIARESVAAGRAVRSDAFAGPRLVTEAFREYENLWYLLDHEARLRPLGGSTFLAGFVFWVPRSIWPDKPLGGGPEIVNFIWPWGYEPGRKDNRSSITPGLMAEGFLNFGAPGVLVAGGFYGLFLGLLARLWSRRGSAVLAGLAVCLSLRAAEFLGMEFFGGLFNLLAVALPFLVALGAESVFAARTPALSESG
ncbi:MAG: O-antigen polymerase [Fimbriimonadales bacterium]